MDLYTNEGLVSHAKKALSLKTKYMWGGIHRTIEKQYDLLFKTYGVDPAKGYTAARWNELAALKNKGYYGVDCVGLIKSYYWSGNAAGGVGSPNYCSSQYPDVPAGTMYNKSKNKGIISTMPEVPGLIVYSATHPHVGIYIGNGETIESTLGSRGDGVVKRKLDNLWEYWLECPYIDYTKPVPVKETLKSVQLAYDANIRSEPKQTAKKLGLLTAGTKCVIVIGSDTLDPVTKYVYVRLGGEKSQWIVKSAIKM